MAEYDNDRFTDVNNKEDRDLNSVSAGSSALTLAGPYGALAALLVQGGIYGYKAYRQNKQAKQLANTKRPEMDVPPAVKEAVQSARLQAANSQLPGQSLMEQKLQSGTSNAIADLKNVSNNPNDLATNVARVYAGQQGQQNNLNIAGAQNYNLNQSMLRGQLGNLGGWQQAAWDYNKNQPYQNDKAAESALREGGFRNVVAGAGNVAQGLGQSAALMYAMRQMRKANEPEDNSIRQNSGNGFIGAVNGMQTGEESVSGSNTNTAKDLQDFYNYQNKGNSKYNFGSMPTYNPNIR